MMNNDKLNDAVFRTVLEGTQEFMAMGLEPVDLAAVLAGAAVLARRMALSKTSTEEGLDVEHAIAAAVRLIEANCKLVNERMADG